MIVCQDDADFRSRILFKSSSSGHLSRLAIRARGASQGGSHRGGILEAVVGLLLHRAKDDVFQPDGKIATVFARRHGRLMALLEQYRSVIVRVERQRSETH